MLWFYNVFGRCLLTYPFYFFRNFSFVVLLLLFLSWSLENLFIINTFILIKQPIYISGTFINPYAIFFGSFFYRTFKHVYTYLKILLYIHKSEFYRPDKKYLSVKLLNKIKIKCCSILQSFLNKNIMPKTFLLACIILFHACD